MKNCLKVISQCFKKKGHYNKTNISNITNKNRIRINYKKGRTKVSLT